MEIDEYYKKLKEEDIYLPPNPQFRQFKIETPSGVMKIKKKITSKKVLLDILRKYNNILNVWYSVNYFLDPTILGRKGKSYHRNLFIFSDLFVVDIDRETIDEQKKAIMDFLAYLHKVNYPPKLIVYTGNKGFHIYLDFLFRSAAMSPIDREKENLDIKKAMIEALEKDSGVVLDKIISWDTRRVVRLPGTIHGKTGNLVEIVDGKDIKDFKPKHVVDIHRERKFEEYI